MRKQIVHIISKKRILLLCLLAVIAVVGMIMAFGTRAAGPYVNSEPENGSISAPATKITDSTASGSSAVRFTPTPAAGTDNEYTFAMIGDTQQETIYETRQPQYLIASSGVYMNQYFNQRMQWLSDNKARLNLKYVWQVGDLQNWDTPNHDQYERASNGLKILERAGIPFTLANGNHDNLATGEGGGARDSARTREYFRTVDTWNSYYPATRFAGIHTLCSEFAQFDARLMAAYPAGMASTDLNHPQSVKNECARSNSTVSAYRTFTAGGLKWLVINYEMWPRQVVQEWMKTVLERYPDHNAVLVSHYNINYGGALSTSGSYGATEGSPQGVFDRVIKNYPNIKIVASGHVSNNADCATVTGVKGNIIHNYLNDRLPGQDTPNYIRSVKINVSGRTITSEHVMPNTAEIAVLPGNPAKCNETNVTWVR